MSETICFVDDDRAELSRFEKAMSGFFTCITATTYSECIEKLQKLKLNPDLWVLDLFFPDQGTTNSPCPYRKPKTADRDRESADTRSRWAILFRDFKSATTKKINGRQK
jgi:CheY-like chemotaxis protein